MQEEKENKNNIEDKENKEENENIEEDKDNPGYNNDEKNEIENNEASNEENIDNNMKETETIKIENNQKENGDINNIKTEEIKPVEEKINELLERISLLEKENKSIKEENSSLKEENININNKITSLEKEFNSSKKENTSLKKEVDTIKKENQKLKKDNESLKKENTNLKNEINTLKKKLSKANLTEEKLKKSNKDNNELKVELQKLKNEKNKKKSPEKIQQNKKKDIGDIINNIPKRAQTDVNEAINDLYKINDERDIKEKEENKDKNEIIINKNINLEKKAKFQSKSPINLKVFKTLTQSSYITYSIDNAFDAFTTISGEILLVYSTKFKSIECFDLIKQKYIKTVLNAHNSMILIIRHYCPKYQNKDLILSSSNNPDYCVKIWDINNWTCIYNLNKAYDKGNMLAVCLHFDEYQKESYIFTSNDCGYIKLWGMDGKFIKNINKTENNETYFLDTYYDKNELKYFLISGEMKCTKSYELNTHQLFRTYLDNNSYAEHVSAFVYQNADVVELVECEFYGYIRIWNFHSGNLIKKIEICKRVPLVSMCLWNKNYLLVSCVDYTIKLVDFKNHVFIKSYNGHSDEVCTIKKIVHPTYGECLISQGIANDQIKMWTND